MYFMLLKIGKVLSKLFFRIRYVDTKHIPEKGKLIVCCNHKSLIDPGLIALAFGRQVHFMAKSEFFYQHGTFIKNLLYRLGAFPVHRDKGDVDAIKTAMSLLENAEVVGIFPQGCIVRDGDMSFHPKAGVALLAQKAKAPILPMSIYSEGKIRLFSRITVRIGEIIPYEALGIDEMGSRRTNRQAICFIAQRVIELLEERH